MKTEEIVPLVKRKIPTIVGFDRNAQATTIGDDARRMGLHGRTTVFNFKPVLGLGDKEFAKDKKYWYYLPESAGQAEQKETFTAKEATQRFLQTLMAKVKVPGKIIIGEPAIREQAWKENFRRHIREAFSEIGLAEPQFFPEPFAVFQYYRHVEKGLPVTDHPELVLIIDIGGGTFNSCIIRTTDQGLLARGGATAVPLGLQADVCGGAEIDKALLQRLIDKCRARGVRWKDDPIQRVQLAHQEALLRVEDAKIYISEAISSQPHVDLTTNYSQIKRAVSFPSGELHPDQEITQELTGEDLKAVIREMWRRHYGRIICETVNEAAKKLQSALGLSLEKIDRVLVAGGSSRLPFMQQEIQAVLPSLIDPSCIYIGSDIGEAVAFGIALECREQAKRDPKLSVKQVSSCITSDLYIGFRRSRREGIEVPAIRVNGELFRDGQLLSAPFETEEFTRVYEIDLPFEVGDRVLYCFSDTPFREDTEPILLNITHDIFSLSLVSKAVRKCELTLTIKPNGFIKPAFRFRGKGSAQSKAGETIDCPEFYSQGFQIKEGATYLGLDFGTSNSYLVKFASIPKELTVHEYPLFALRPAIKEKLRQFELRLEKLRQAGRLSKQRLVGHAADQMLEIIFHSNKIEGNSLTKGETISLLSDAHRSALTPTEREAKNLEIAYKWMIENAGECGETPELFIRHLNSLILHGVKAGGGEYRTSSIAISGTEFDPPPAASVAAFMRQLSEEMRHQLRGRSPIECAVAFHTKLVWIHPFVDGNGRTARLLLNSVLFSCGLPVIVINYADRERYLDCLNDSNRGDISALVEFVMECFQEQLAEFETASEVSSDDLTTKPSVTFEADKEVDDPIVAVLHEVGVPELEDPLAAIMKGKVLERQKAMEAEYDAWKQSMLILPAELLMIVDEFNSSEGYRQAGYSMRVQKYDMLTFDKYAEMALGKRAARTWFVGVEITGPQSRERTMWFFNGASRALRKTGAASSVSLAISRFDGARFVRLSSEPIELREIGYRKGELTFVSRDGSLQDGNCRRNLRAFMADIIKAYL